MEPKIACTSSIMSTKAIIDGAGIMVGDPVEWLTLLVDSEKRTWSSFGNCVIPFYKFQFKRIWIRFPFSHFEVVVIKYLICVPSQPHQGLWA